MASPSPVFVLGLRDGSRWALSGADDRGARVVARAAAIAGLAPGGADEAGALLVGEPGSAGCAAGAGSVMSLLELHALADGRRGRFCALPDPATFDDATVTPLQVLNVPAYYSVLGGGALLHAALLVREGRGFLVAGRSGAGKSTAARRAPAGWEARCDDMALAVRDGGGRWWAHPWPTRGRVIVEGEGSWDVQAAVPVAGVFFLEQAADDEALALGRGEGLCLLNEAAEQVSWLLGQGMGAEALRELRLRQFESLARLAADVPCRRLRATLHGEFWREILRVSAGEERPACARS